MPNTILITGSTDGIGRLAAEALAAQGHKVLLHGRSASKLESVANAIAGETETYSADLSRIGEVLSLATKVIDKHRRLDVLINNAGVYKTQRPRTADGHDVRFVVNTIAPYVLTQRLLPIIPNTGRVVNLSSAAQAPVQLDALAGERQLDDMAAYAQSKLAITIWSREMAKKLRDGPVVVSVNPGSLLATKMVKEGFGVSGNDVTIGSDIVCKAALDPSFADASGKYFDNDAGRFGAPHSAALDGDHARAVMQRIEAVAAALQQDGGSPG